MNRCPACGTTYPDDARFCPKDGSRLVVSVARTPTPPIASPVIPAAPSFAPTPFSGPTPARGTMAGRAEPPAPVTHTRLIGSILDGRYQIEKKIGEGGMSFVYLATDITTKEHFAIKVLSAALSRDQNAMARLKREASLGMRRRTSRTPSPPRRAAGRSMAACWGGCSGGSADRREIGAGWHIVPHAPSPA